MRGTHPTTPFPRTSLSTANQLPRRPTTWSRRTEPNGVFQLATASVLLPGARRIGTFAFQSTTRVSHAPRRGRTARASRRARASTRSRHRRAPGRGGDRPCYRKFSSRSARRVKDSASDTGGRPAYRPSSLDAVLEDVVTPAGPYRLRLMARSGTWRGALPGNRRAAAHQRPDGRVVVRAPDEPALATARFMLALDDDTAGFHERFARDPLSAVGTRLRRLPAAPPRDRDARSRPRALRPAHRGPPCPRDRAAIAAPAADASSPSPALRRLAPVELRRFGLAQHRSTVLARLATTLDLERLRDLPATLSSPASRASEASARGRSG